MRVRIRGIDHFGASGGITSLMRPGPRPLIAGGSLLDARR